MSSGPPVKQFKQTSMFWFTKSDVTDKA